MAKRCEHCRFWEDTVFKQETPSGWGIWYGTCLRDGHDGESLFFACQYFESKPPEFKEIGDKIENILTKLSTNRAG